MRHATVFHTFHLAPTKYYYVCNLDSSHLFQFSLKGLFDITDGSIEVKPGWHGKVCRVYLFVLDPELFISVHIVSLVTSRMIDFIFEMNHFSQLEFSQQ